MTLHSPQAAASTNAQAPVLPADTAQAKELWEQVKGTAKEADFRAISARHDKKADNRANYQAFLDDLKNMFAVPQPQIPDFQPHLPVPQAPPVAQVSAASEEPDLSPDPGDVQPDPVREETPTDDGNHQPEPHLPAANSGAKAPTAPPVSSGLLAQLAGMLAEGGEMTFQLMRVGDQLTVGVFPKPHPGEQGPQPLVLSATPDWLDANLASAIAMPGGYADARRDAFAVCQAAASKQQAANKRVESKPASKPATPSKARTSTVTLNAAEGTTFTGKLGPQTVDLAIGDNEVPQGTLEISATHPFFGECKKTLSTFSAKTHDFTEQQGARITVNVTPESAAVTATKDETVLTLHGETLLPAGSWLITAEAADHTKVEQRLTVKPGKPQVIELALKPDLTPGLF